MITPPLTEQVWFVTQDYLKHKERHEIHLEPIPGQLKKMPDMGVLFVYGKIEMSDRTEICEARLAYGLGR